jgi:hypothetical protein
MTKCIDPNWSKDGILNCVCNYTLRWCDLHYDQNHISNNSKVPHSMILVNNFIQITGSGLGNIKKLKTA